MSAPEIPDTDEESGPISPAALVVYISPDQLARWRLWKSVAIDNAEWALKAGRRDIAAQQVRGARFCHLQILRIKAHVRSRAGGLSTHELERLGQRLAALRLENAHEIEDEAAVRAGARDAATDRQRAERLEHREAHEGQHQDHDDVSRPRDGEAQPAEGFDGRRTPSGSSRSWPRKIPPGQLSTREQQITTLLADGLKPKRIAAALDVSPHVVYVTTGAAVKRLGLTSKAELIAWELERRARKAAA